MGPIALFDKSFLQSLRLDEAVMFDCFFTANISPLFFMETLADLEKAVSAGRTPEQEVGSIAEKTPQLSGAPNSFHGQLCLGSLLGHKVEMENRPVLVGGKLVRTGGRTGVVFDEPPEAIALSRWRDGSFLEVEREFASAWRASLGSEDPQAVLDRFRGVGIDWAGVRSLQDARDMAAEIVQDRKRKAARFSLMLALLRTPRRAGGPILERWRRLGSPPVAEYAPYASFVLEVLFFYYLAVGKSLISAERASNKVDIAYLFYLPFCMLFTSSDKLHRRCAPLFTSGNQEFVWGPDLKTDLGEIDQHLDRLPDSEKEQGLFEIASRPPDRQGSVVAGLWDRFLRPDWRQDDESGPTEREAASRDIGNEIQLLRESAALKPEEIDFDPADPDSLVIERRILHKRGKWWQVPKDINTRAAKSKFEAVLKACEDAQWRPEDPRVVDVLADFATGRWAYHTALEIVAETIRAVWREAPTVPQAEAVTERLLTRVAERTDHRKIIEEVIDEVESLLGLAVTRAESLRRCLRIFPHDHSRS